MSNNFLFVTGATTILQAVDCSLDSFPRLLPPSPRLLVDYPKGIMDNFVMISAGDLIDNTLGVKFGLATLTAAACGQVVRRVVLELQQSPRFARSVALQPSSTIDHYTTAAQSENNVFGTVDGILCTSVCS